MRSICAFLLLCCAVLHAGETEGGIPLLQAARVQGGLCLVLGAKDLALAKELAGTSALYVQVLQPEAKAALAWGLETATGPLRESLAVRHAAFAAAHYDASLFNLIVVENAAALGPATLAEFGRILVPEGVVAFRTAPATAAEAAKGLGMAAVAAPGYTAFRQPAKPQAWKPETELKWLAGPRSQIANGFAGTCSAMGRIFYIEQLERDLGTLTDAAPVLHARDACNGRLLWSLELSGGYSSRTCAATVTRSGRLFVKTGSTQILCVDGLTGKVLFEVLPTSNREGRIWLVSDDLLYVGFEKLLRSTATGKPLPDWAYPNANGHPLGGAVVGANICFSDGKSLFAKVLATGAEAWRVDISALPKMTGGLMGAGDKLVARFAATKRDEAPFAVFDGANGKLLWQATWTSPGPASDQYYKTSDALYFAVDGKLLLTARRNQPDKYADEIALARFDLATGKPDFTDKVLKTAADFHGCFGGNRLGDWHATYDLWLDLKNLVAVEHRMPHPACFSGSLIACDRVYDFPSRKSGPITAVGLSEPLPAPSGAPGERVALGPAPAARATTPADWPMFRGGPNGGNASGEKPGAKLSKLWEAKLGLGTRSFGLMSSQPGGLSQAVVGYGLAVVADLDAQRIVAVDAATGQQRWVYPVGSRVVFPPTLYNGLCLVPARDGWIHALDAATGKPVYRLRAAASERYRGGWDKLESRWAIESDIWLSGGIAHVAGGAPGGFAFKPETGEAVAVEQATQLVLGRAKPPAGRELILDFGTVLKGNSIPRTNEDNAEGFRRRRFDHQVDGRVLAFDDALTVCYKFTPKGEGWANTGEMRISAIAGDPKKPVWSNGPIELVVSDLVLTPDHVYCAGHFQREKKAPELWVLSRQDGKLVATVPLDGFPAFLGMSAAGGRLYIATREGRLLCFGSR